MIQLSTGSSRNGKDALPSVPEPCFQTAPLAPSPAAGAAALPPPASTVDVPLKADALPGPNQAVDASSPDNVHPSTPHSQPAFERFPAETPRAFSAFMAFFSLGHARSLARLAEELDEKLDTLKKWSSRFRWTERINSLNSGLLQQQVAAEAAARAQEAADWARRTSQYREREWQTAQKLLAAVQCFLEGFGDREVEKMTLGQISRAFQISSRIARQALSGSGADEGPVLAPIQIELTAALKKAYAQPPPEVGRVNGQSGSDPCAPPLSSDALLSSV